jgi:hypothetical protein
MIADLGLRIADLQFKSSILQSAMELPDEFPGRF